MKLAKTFLVAAASTLMVIALSVFSLAFCIQQTVLNPGFVKGQLEKLDYPTAVSEAVDLGTGGSAREMEASIRESLEELEPEIKAGAEQIVDSVFDYINGRAPLPGPRGLVRDNLVTPDLVKSIIDTLDITDITRTLLAEKMGSAIYHGLSDLIHLDQALRAALLEQEGWIRDRLKEHAAEIADYVTGINRNISITLVTGPFLSSLRPPLYELFTAEPPEGVSPDDAPAEFERLFGIIEDEVPSEITLSEADLGLGSVPQLEEVSADFTSVLDRLKSLAGILRIALISSAILLLVISASIVLLDRNALALSLNAAVIFAVSGTLTLAGGLAGKAAIASAVTNNLDAPPSIQAWLQNAASGSLSPLVILGAVYLGLSAALAGVYLFYRRKNTISY